MFWLFSDYFTQRLSASIIFPFIIIAYIDCVYFACLFIVASPNTCLFYFVKFCPSVKRLHDVAVLEKLCYDRRRLHETDCAAAAADDQDGGDGDNGGFKRQHQTNVFTVETPSITLP